MAVGTSSWNSHLLSTVPGSNLVTGSTKLLDLEKLLATEMFIYIYSTNKYRRSIFPVWTIQSIFVIVSEENAEEKSCPSSKFQTFPFQRWLRVWKKWNVERLIWYDGLLSQPNIKRDYLIEAIKGKKRPWFLRCLLCGETAPFCFYHWRELNYVKQSLYPQQLFFNLKRKE